MSQLAAGLVLASRSPRRLSLLQSVGISSVVLSSEFDELSVKVNDPRRCARLIAEGKCLWLLQHAPPAEGSFVLAADTIVVVNDQQLGKPTDEADAIRMLTLLVGNEHAVVTAVSLAKVGQGVIETIDVTTRVYMQACDEATLLRYVESGECWDKAGAYAIQGLAGGLVERIDGSYSNVVGLPLQQTLALLKRHGALLRWP